MYLSATHLKDPLKLVRVSAVMQYTNKCFFSLVAQSRKQNHEELFYVLFTDRSKMLK